LLSYDLNDDLVTRTMDNLVKNIA